MSELMLLVALGLIIAGTLTNITVVPWALSVVQTAGAVIRGKDCFLD